MLRKCHYGGQNEANRCQTSSIGAGLAQADHEDFQDRAGIEQAATFEVEVGLQEDGGKLVDAVRAEVGVLFSGLVDGEWRDAGGSAGLVEIESGCAEAAGVMDFEQVRAHRREQWSWLLTGHQQVIEKL